MELRVCANTCLATMASTGKVSMMVDGRVECLKPQDAPQTALFQRLPKIAMGSVLGDGSTVPTDPLVPQSSSLGPLRSERSMVSFVDLHRRVLDVVSPKPKIVSRYNIGGLTRLLNPDPLSTTPFGIRLHSHEFVPSALEGCDTVPKFIPAVLGSFPAESGDFVTKVYTAWENTVKGINTLYGADGVLTLEEGTQLKVELDKVVAKRAQMSRHFINATRVAYMGKEFKLEQVVGPWMKTFFVEIDQSVHTFMKHCETKLALTAIDRIDGILLDLISKSQTKAVVSTASTQTDE